MHEDGVRAARARPCTLIATPRIGIGEKVVMDLLGTGDPAKRRRARFRKDALRVAAALAATAPLVIVGLEVTPDADPDGSVFGRTGHIRTP